MKSLTTFGRRPTTPAGFVVAFLLGGGLTACSGMEGLSPLDEPQSLGTALAFLHRETAALIIVDPEGEAGPKGGRKVHRVEVGGSPKWARTIPKAGAPGETMVVVANPAINEVLLVEDKSGATTTLSLGVPMEEVEFSPDGEWGIAFQPDGTAPTSSLVAFPNTISILHLGSDPSTETLRLGAGGARPLAVRFSKPLQMTRGSDIDTAVVAFVFVRGGIVPVDVTHGFAAPFVPVTLDETVAVTPAEVIFTNNQGDAITGAVDDVERAFVRTTSGELFVFSLTLNGSEDEPLLVALENIVTPDTVVDDMELYFDGVGNSILLAAARMELILVDGFSGVAERFPSPTRVDRLVRFVDAQTLDGLALGYSGNTPAAQLLRIDPLRLMERRSTGLTNVPLANPVQQVDVLNESNRAVLRYRDERDIGVLELTANGELLDLAMASPPLAQSLVEEGERMLVASEDPLDGAPHLSEIDLDSFTIRSARLDDEAVRVGRQGNFLWVQSHEHSGTVTFFPADDLRREAAMRFAGLAYARLLEEPTSDAQGEPQ